MKATKQAVAAAGAALTLALTLAACSTGVDDEKGWNKVLTKNYPCSELLDVAEDLPSSIDPQKVADDLRKAGCDPSALNSPATTAAP